MRRSHSFGAVLIDAQRSDDLTQLLPHLSHLVAQVHQLGSHGAAVRFQSVDAFRIPVVIVRIGPVVFRFLLGAHLLRCGDEGIAPLPERRGHEPELVELLGPAFDLGRDHAPFDVRHLVADLGDLCRDAFQADGRDLRCRETGELLRLLCVHDLEGSGVVDGGVHAAGDVGYIHPGRDEGLLDLSSARVHRRDLLLHIGDVLGLLPGFRRIRRHHGLQGLHGGRQPPDLVVYEPELPLVLAGRHRMVPPGECSWFSPSSFSSSWSSSRSGSWRRPRRRGSRRSRSAPLCIRERTGRPAGS